MSLADWTCRARTRLEKGKKQLQPCHGRNPGASAVCVTCGSPFDAERTAAGDLLRPGDIVATPEGWHRDVKRVEPSGFVELSLDRPHIARELKRLFPVYRAED